MMEPTSSTVCPSVVLPYNCPRRSVNTPWSVYRYRGKREEGRGKREREDYKPFPVCFHLQCWKGYPGEPCLQQINPLCWVGALNLIVTETSNFALAKFSQSMFMLIINGHFKAVWNGAWLLGSVLSHSDSGYFWLVDKNSQVVVMLSTLSTVRHIICWIRINVNTVTAVDCGVFLI